MIFQKTMLEKHDVDITGPQEFQRLSCVVRHIDRNLIAEKAIRFKPGMQNLAHRHVVAEEACLGLDCDTLAANGCDRVER